MIEDILKSAVAANQAIHKQAVESVDEGCKRMNRIVGDLQFTVKDLHEENDAKAAEETK